MEASQQEAITFVITVSDMIENCRNKSHRSYLMEILEGGLKSITWKNDTLFQNEIINLQSKISKWIKVDELEGLSLRLLAVCLAHGPTKTFEAEYDSFVSKKILRKNWKTHSRKDHFLEAILILIQGDYIGKRIFWQPFSIPGYQYPQWNSKDTFSSYKCLSLNNDSSKVSARLRTLCSAIFQKAILKTPDANTICVCQKLFLQISAYSLQFTKAVLLPMVVSEKVYIVGDRIIAFKSFYEILHPKKEFTKFCDDMKSQHAMFYRELQVRINTIFGEALKNVGPETYTMIGLPFYPINYSNSSLSIDYLKLLNHHNFSSSSSSIHDYHFNIINNCILRFKFLNEESFPSLHIAQGKNYSNRIVHEAILNWCQSSNLSYMDCEYSESLPPSPSIYRVEYKDKIQIEFATFIIKCFRICTTTSFWMNFQESSFCHLLLHPDKELSQATSNTLQILMEEYPEYRCKIMNILIKSALETTEITTGGIETYLSHIVYLLDFWISLNKQQQQQNTSLSSSSSSSSSTNYKNELDNLDISLLENGECIAMIYLCHHSPSVRGFCIQLIHCLYGLYPSETKCISSLLYKNEKDILEKARFRFLKYISFGNIDAIKISSQSPLLSIEKISLSNNYLLWCFVLSEIISIITDEKLTCIYEARNKIFSNKLNNIKIDESISNFSEMAVSRAYYHLFMFSTSDTSLNKIPHLSSFKEYIFNDYWNNLQSENDFILEEMFIVICSIHHSIIHQVLGSLLKYYTDLGKKTKLKVHQSFAKLISRIVSSDSFNQIIKLGDLSTCESTTQIIDELIITLESLSSQPRTSLNPLIIYISQIISYFCKSMQKTYLFCKNGPLRVNLFSSLTKVFNWPIKDRQKLYQILFQYGGNKNNSSHSTNMNNHDNNLINSSTSSTTITNSSNLLNNNQSSKLITQKTSQGSSINLLGGSSGSRQNLIRSSDLSSSTLSSNSSSSNSVFLQQFVHKEINLAFASLVHLGPLFDQDQKISIEIINWATQIDRKYFTLRSLLSFQFKNLFPIFVSHSYKHPKSDLFIHAIFDQFVEPQQNNHQNQRNNNNYYQIQSLYIKNKQNIDRSKKLIPKREILATNKQDQEFTEIIQENVGVFIFLLFMNLVHPDQYVRKRTFQVTRRLVPICFGKDQSRTPSQNTIDTQLELDHFEHLFSSQIIEIITQSALDVSSITARICNDFTDSVFNEAFVRMPNISSDSQKFWALEFLLPWCDHINLELMNNCDEFLQKIFKYLTLDITQGKFKIPQEIIIFWQRLACAKPTNHPIIVDFLLQNINRPSCRTLIIYLYRTDNQPSLDHLIYPLTFQGNTAFFQFHPDLHYNLFSKKDEAITHVRLCNSTIIILSDFIIDSITQLLPYLHVALTWSIILFNNPQEQPSLALFLSNVIQALLNILQTNHFGDQHFYNRLQIIIEKLSPDNCTDLLWDYNHYCNESSLNPSPYPPTLNSFSSTSANATSSSSNTDDSMDQSSLQANDVDQDSSSSYYIDENYRLYGKELIQVLCQSFQLMGAGDLITAWVDETLQWATSKFPSSISIIGLEMFNILQSNEISIQQANILLRYFAITFTLFQSSIDHYTLLLIRTNRFEPKESRQLSSTSIPALRSILHVILDIFSNCVPEILAKGKYSFSLHIFWIIVSLLRINHSAFKPLSYKALHLSKILMDSQFYTNIPISIFRSQERELSKSPDWKFIGILPLTIFAIYNKHTESLAIDCFIKLLKIPNNDLIFQLTNGDKSSKKKDSFIAEFRVILSCLLPYFHCALIKNQLNNPSTIKLIEFIKELIAENCSLKHKSAFSPFLSVIVNLSNGSLHSDPDSLLHSIIESVCRKASIYAISRISGMFFICFFICFLYLFVCFF